MIKPIADTNINEPISETVTLLVGFDSAWTRHNSGSLVAALRTDSGVIEELEPPQLANFSQAEQTIKAWQVQRRPDRTIILLDQPTIVKNRGGQRPVENLVSSPVRLRYGGVQPANIGRSDMFGEAAPVWAFLDAFGGAANPDSLTGSSWIVETYPVLAMIALGWLLPDKRSTGRLPKYNPARKNTFSLGDWQYICEQVSQELSERQMTKLACWVDDNRSLKYPRKHDQDRLDACICLLVSMWLVEKRECLLIGNFESGYMVVPGQKLLAKELQSRCVATSRNPSHWVRCLTL